MTADRAYVVVLWGLGLAFVLTAICGGLVCCSSSRAA